MRQPEAKLDISVEPAGGTSYPSAPTHSNPPQVTGWALSGVYSNVTLR